MGHAIALNFEDGFTRFIDCRDGETVAGASYRAGINIPLDCPSSEVCKTRGQVFQARIRSVEKPSATTIAFSLEGAGPLSFLPGQYANILVPGTDQRRSYSFSLPPATETQSFLVRDIPPGLMSTFLRERAKPGMAMEFVGPSGGFYPREIRLRSPRPNKTRVFEAVNRRMR